MCMMWKFARVTIVQLGEFYKAGTQVAPTRGGQRGAAAPASPSLPPSGHRLPRGQPVLPFAHAGRSAASRALGHADCAPVAVAPLASAGDSQGPVSHSGGHFRLQAAASQPVPAAPDGSSEPRAEELGDRARLCLKCSYFVHHEIFCLNFHLFGYCTKAFFNRDS